MSSCQQQHEEEGRAVAVIDAAPGDTAPRAGTWCSVTGKLGIPVLIAPVNLQQQQQQRDGGGGGASEMNMMAPFHGFLVLQQEEEEDPETQRKKWFKEMRGWLMVLATVAASASYQAGLNPPGGFWQEGDRAGNPVLRDMHQRKYLIFYYFNATSFVTSLVIMVLLMNERFYLKEAKVMALVLTTLVDLTSLVGAYIAGSTRFLSTCIYVIVIVCVSFVSVIYIGAGMMDICLFFMKRVWWMRKLATLRCMPVPEEVLRRLEQEGEADRERSKKRRAAAAAKEEATSTSRPRRPCCLCCGAGAASGDHKRDVEGQ